MQYIPTASEAFETYHTNTGHARSDAAVAYGKIIGVHDAEQIRAALYAESSFEQHDRRGTIRALITCRTVVSNKHWIQDSHFGVIRTDGRDPDQGAKHHSVSAALAKSFRFYTRTSYTR